MCVCRLCFPPDPARQREPGFHLRNIDPLELMADDINRRLKRKYRLIRFVNLRKVNLLLDWPSRHGTDGQCRLESVKSQKHVNGRNKTLFWWFSSFSVPSPLIKIALRWLKCFNTRAGDSGWKWGRGCDNDVSLGYFNLHFYGRGKDSLKSWLFWHFQ